LAIAFFHLIPESLELNKDALFYVFAGFLLFFILESSIIIHAGPELHHIEHTGEGKMHISAQMAFLGLLLHSLIDGIIIGVSFKVGDGIGMLTTFSIIMHELPEGITTYSLMILSDSTKTAMKKSYAVALATPVGAVLSLFFIKNMSESVMGILLAIASGTFIYVAAADLIPETHNHKGWSNIFLLFLGILLIYTISKFTSI
ncbi:ZIP family metal transporter, partial [bacterium]|nr:ZIP family metal transporter [bacterium]